MINKENIEKSLDRDGFYILKNVFNTEKLKNYKKKIFDHIDLYPNTRPSPNSRHLAGFHRYPELISIHTDLLSNSQIQDVINLIPDNGKMISIGLSDITINRSQPWHSDLLRGKYKKYIKNKDEGGVYKILLYLQKGKNLKVVSGSHNVSLKLDDKLSEDYASKKEVKTLELDQGDVIIMDIRLQHAGATEEEMFHKTLDDDAKILVATVVGDTSKKLTQEMIIGNTYRQDDWDQRHMSHLNYP